MHSSPAKISNLTKNTDKMLRPSRSLILPSRKFSSSTTSAQKPHHHFPSYGFSGAGFLGCYHVGVAACLRKHGHLPHPESKGVMPLLTGVSAGSMISAAIVVGVDPEVDGMEIVLEAARRTRKLSKQFSTTIPLDALTPGLSLIDQVEGPFREALVKALGGYCVMDETTGKFTIHDIDPEIFGRRVQPGLLRIGLTDKRGLWPTPVGTLRQRYMDSYCYVDSYRDIEDVIACSMLSSYVPGLTGSLNGVKDDLPAFLSGLLSNDNNNGLDKGSSSNNSIRNDTTVRAGLRLNEMTNLGMVKYGSTGLPVIGIGEDESVNNTDANNSTLYWDGGIVDVFPTIDEHTVVISPLNGFYDQNPSICPLMPDEELCDNSEDDNQQQQEQSNRNTPASKQMNNSILFNYLRPYLPSTFRHCRKSQLGFNTKNANAALRMMFSSDDDELYSRFRGGYDDARRFLNERGQLSVFSV